MNTEIATPDDLENANLDEIVLGVDLDCEEHEDVVNVEEDDEDFDAPDWPENDPRWDGYWRWIASYYPAGSEERALLQN
jgi:hypothetical protein